jgi:hypothetical protein
MIKRIKVYGRKAGVWSRGGIFLVPPISPTEILTESVLFEKEYPEGTLTRDIWREIREAIIKHFYNIFYPAIVMQTAISDERLPHYVTKVHRGEIKFVSRRVASQMDRFPEYYTWNPVLKKWHMTLRGYKERTGKLDIAVAESPYEELHDYSLIEAMQEKLKGKTIRLILMVYPDRYDTEVRALFQLEIEFYA